jgi:hypothetical protein
VLADAEPDADAKYVADAARSGSLKLVKWLYAKGYRVGGEAMANAAESGNVDLCKWVLGHGIDPTQDAMEAALEGGHVEVLEWLSAMGGTCTSQLLCDAIAVSGVPVVAWCLDHHPHPPDGGYLLELSCLRYQGSEVFEYLADHRGFEESPTELMKAVAHGIFVEFENAFDAAVLTTRYGTPLFPNYMMRAIYHEDVGRVRFALSQGQDVSEECYELLIDNADATLLNEVLLARTVGGSIPEVDHKRIKEALHRFKCRENVSEVLAYHSIVV